jgi:hypothetical protein
MGEASPPRGFTARAPGLHANVKMLRMRSGVRIRLTASLATDGTIAAP